MSPRRRDPGFYVSVLAPAGMGSGRAELLDGPWPTRAAAERRMGEIASGRPADGPGPSIVQVTDDGITILRDDSA